MRPLGRALSLTGLTAVEGEGPGLSRSATAAALHGCVVSSKNCALMSRSIHAEL